MGKTSSKNFLQTIRIKVIATDGYTTAEDNLEIRIYLIPFATVINYIISIEECKDSSPFSCRKMAKR